MQRRRVLSLSAIALLALGRAHAEPPEDRIFTRVETALGSFVIAVDPKRAPITVANYLAHVDAGWLDGGSVYRIVTPSNQPPETAHKIEVVQWGMNLPDDQAPPRPPIAHETTAQTGLRHRDGTVSMARSTPGSATAEFFICIGDQPELDFGGRRNPDGQGFAAFGQIVAGHDTVRALYRQGASEQYLKPPIAVRSVRRLSPQEATALSLQTPASR